MHRLISHIPMLLAGALVALVLAGQGGARSAEVVSCSSTTASGPVNLTGTWTANDGLPYYLRQIGSCLWWAGGKAGFNVFFGTVFGSTVTGVWIDVFSRSSTASGRLTLLISSRNTKLYLRSSTGRFPASSWRKTG